MKENAFTLIELLAVIVILAIIALIATPIVLNIIEDSKKSAFLQTGNGIVDAAQYYYMNEMSNGVKPTKEKKFTFNGSKNGLEGLDFDGEIPKEGSIIITPEGEVAIGITDGNYCLTKDFKDSSVTVTKDIKNCKAMYKNGIMLSENQCVIKGNTCIPNEDGIIVIVKVNDEQTEEFYVLADDGNKITLILNRNLGNDVEWISKTNYIEAGGTEVEFGSYGNNNKGPLTALTALQSQTSEWTNLREITIDTLAQSFTMYARLPKYNEIYVINNSNTLINTPWLYINLYSTGDDSQDSKGNYKSGYWTGTAFTGQSHRAYYVTDTGHINYYPGTVNYGGSLGVRPVIELYK